MLTSVLDSKNPDKKLLGEPNVTKLTPEARERLAQLAARIAA
jgi:hypothetical protein